jgi:hypothetical protein
MGALIDLCEVPLNHKPLVTSGVLEDEAVAILKEYFKKKREK